MLLDCQNICKSFGVQELFKNVSFHIENNDKAALVGINGCGKTTLLKIITGEIPADSGKVVFSGGAGFGYLAQQQDVNGSISIYDYVLEAKRSLLEKEKELRELEQTMKTAQSDRLQSMMDRYSRLSHEFDIENGYAIQSEITGVLTGLGFKENDFNRSLSTLSGGQKTRVALGRTLLSKPDLLILDEPTNHLDMNSINWLETHLINYSGAVLIVSHDRYFLDRIVNKVIEIENGTSICFNGNYTRFREKKAVVRKAKYNAYLKQLAEIKHQEAVISKLKSFNREKSVKRAQSREKMLAKTVPLIKPREEKSDMILRLAPRFESGSDVLAVSEISKSYSGKTLFQDLSFEIHKGEHVALIGSNGTGKTTILKMITGLVSCDGGSIKTGAKVNIGYYDQEHQMLDPEKTVFDEISDAYPEMTETRIRNTLAAFLFTGDDVFNRIKTLSGGERGRVSLAKLMLSEANFLILDEPTNHLDIYSREILEEALKNYTGTLLYVSHDRYFINSTASRILELKEGLLISYIGNYDYYLEKKDELTRLSIAQNSSIRSENLKDKVSSGASDWKAQKEEQARIRKKENDIKKLEALITSLEDKISTVNEQINLPENSNNHEKLAALVKELDELNSELEKAYESWGSHIMHSPE